MSEPTSVRLKRKATEDAPDILVVKSQKRRASNKLRYIRQAGKDEVLKKEQVASKALNDAHSVQTPKRIFQLSRGRKRKSEDGEDGKDDHEMITVTEKRSRSEERLSEDANDEPRFSPPTSRTFKRPSRFAAIKRRDDVRAATETEDDRKCLQELADYMHQAALEEVKHEKIARELPTRDAQHKAVATPRISGRQSLERHRRRTTPNGSCNGSPNATPEKSPAEESSYVYDTYVLAPASEMDIDSEETGLSNKLDSVGYLVIEEEDEALWESHFVHEADDKDWNSEDEDENAEDYYGADYPEDELDSEDEYDRHVYGYRGRDASDDEEEDEDAGALSDDEEWDNVPNPLRHIKTPIRFAEDLEAGDESD